MSEGRETWDLFVIEYARSGLQSQATLYAGAYDDRPVHIPFSFVLARTANRTVLVDCGFDNTGAAATIGFKVNVRSWISPLRMLAECGVTPADVDTVIATHAHFDHVGTIAEFTRARIFLQKREYDWWREALAMPPRFGALTAAVHEPDLRALSDASLQGRLILVEGDADDLVPGIDVRTGPGHTPGQQFVIFETARGRMVISADGVYGARNIRGLDNDGVYAPLGSGIGSDLDQLMTIDRLNTEIGGDLSKLIIMHDPDGWPHLEHHAEVDGFRIMKSA